MNGCEFCGNYEAKHWIEINEKSRLFCSEIHSLQFESILKTLKFKAGWSTVDMLIVKETSQRWICKAFRGMASIEFEVNFDEIGRVTEFNSY